MTKARWRCEGGCEDEDLEGKRLRQVDAASAIDVSSEGCGP